jgi:hypothetical protein
MSADRRSDQEIMAALPTESEFTHSIRTGYIFRFERLNRDLGNFIEDSNSWRERIETKIDAVISEAESNKRFRKALMRSAMVAGGVISFLVSVADRLWALVTQ